MKAALRLPISLSRAGLPLSVLLVLALLPLPASAVVPDVPNLASPTHPVETTWYADDSPQITWDPASSLPALLGSYDTLGTAYGVAVAGDTAYVADGSYGLRVFDVSDSTAPLLLGTYNTPGTAYGVAVAGDTAYVADGTSGLQVIDVTDTSAPALLGTYNTPGTAEAVTVAGDTAYVADGTTGLRIIDVRNPAAPVHRGAYDTPGYASDVVVSGGNAFVADGTAGLRIIDVSSPATPVHRGHYDTPGAAMGVAVAGDKAYVADEASGLHVINVQSLTSPTLLASCDTPGYAMDVVMAGGTAYVADYDSGLHIIDVTVSSGPLLLGSYDTPRQAYGVVVRGDSAYVADGTSGLQIIDISDVDEPIALSSYRDERDGEKPARVEVDGDIAYLLTNYSLQLIDVSDVHTPTLVGDCSVGGTDIAIAGDFAFVAGSSGNLRVIDISDHTAPALVQSFTIGDPAYSTIEEVAISGNLAFVVGYVDDGYGTELWSKDTAQLQVIDISSPTAPAILGSFYEKGEFGDAYTGIDVSGNTAYVTAGPRGIRIIDVSVPGLPTLLASSDAEGNSTGYTNAVEVAGDIAYVLDYHFGVQVWDVTNTTSPLLLDQVAMPLHGDSNQEKGEGLTVAGDQLYVAGSYIDTDDYWVPGGSMTVIDVTDPASCLPLFTYDAPGYAEAIAVAGDVAYVAKDWGGVEWGIEAVDVGHGPVGYSYTLDQSPTTVPDTTIETLSTSATFASVTGGEWYFHVRAVGEGSRAGTAAHRRVRINTAPVLAAIGDKSVNELSQLTFTATATDADLPAQTLTYRLAIAAPAGAAMTPDGAFTWMPTEAQGPGSYPITVIVTDGTESDFETITVMVAEVNTAPVLTPIGDKSVNELSQLTFTATATDADLPAQTLVFGLEDAPEGATIDPSTGVFSWTPTGAQGPASHTFTVTVSDDEGLMDAKSVTVTVTSSPVVLVPVYRFYNSRLGTHFYTASEAEKDNVKATLSHIFTFEGPAYYMNPAANAQPLHRFYLKASGTHFYTANEAEKANVINTLSHVYAYEGPAYNVSSAPGPGRTVVYRFYHRSNGTHFYTANEAEKVYVQNSLSHVYQFEGQAFWIGQ